MSDEPGLPATDEKKAALMVRMVEAALHTDTADGRAGLGALLRELRHLDPLMLDHLVRALQLRGVSQGQSTAH